MDGGWLDLGIGLEWGTAGPVLSFAVSGVRTWAWLPPLAAFVVSFFSSMVGISGAFLLLPFQMSLLNFTSPAVSSTNLVFNLVAIPSGVWRYVRERRMAWPLAWIVIAGTLPGIALGYYLRVWYLPNPARFKVFAGCVLLYIAYRVLSEFVPRKAQLAPRRDGAAFPVIDDTTIRGRRFSLARVEYEFQGDVFSFNTCGMFLLAFVVGIVGGTYGIGGGSIIAPFCVAFFRLPIHSIAGAALMGTLVTSAAGVAVYSLMPAPEGIVVQPDWALGMLFGLGGIAGMYLGARLQKFMPQTVLKVLLGILLLFLSGQYLLPAWH